MNVDGDYKEACPYKMVIGAVMKELGVVDIDIFEGTDDVLLGHYDSFKMTG